MNRLYRFAAYAVAALAFTASVAQAAPVLPSLADLAKKAGPAVVNISTEREVTGRRGRVMPGMPPGMERFFEQMDPSQNGPGLRKQNALGSGFIVSADGYIVTNNHVVDGADKIFVNFQDDGEKTQPLPAKLIGIDTETDIALLKVENGKPLPVLSFGDSDALEVGDWVMAIGNPFGLSNTVTAGILSAKGRDIHAGPFDSFLQTDASINPGNSGGPLINMKGEVIGINTAIVASGQGIGFAIPSSQASRVVQELQSGKKVSRGWLGVSIQDMDENAAKALGAKDAKGALIGSIMPGEPAAKAGLKAGDIIVRIDKTDILDAAALLRRVADIAPGTSVQVVVLRGGKEVSVVVVLGERSVHNGTAAPDKGAEGKSLGLTIRPLTKEDTRSLRLSPDIRGLVVLAVEPDGTADQVGMQPGDVILSANLTPVTTVEELTSIIKKEGRERGAVMLQITRKNETFFASIPLDKDSKK